MVNTLSIVGVGLTMTLTIKDTTKAQKIVRKDMTTKEKIQKTWKCYIPSGLTAIGTIGCIIYSDRLRENEKATLLALIATMKSNYNMVMNSIDKNCTPEDQEKILKDIIRQDVPKDVYIERTDDKTFYDEYSDRCFLSTVESVLKAEYMFNRQLSIVGKAPINDFYNYLGIEGVQDGDLVGWVIDDNKVGVTANPWVDFKHETIIADDEFEYYLISYDRQPVEIY